MNASQAQDQVEEALVGALRAARASSTPEVVAHSFELDRDPWGRESARIVVVLRDRADGTEYDWTALKPIEDAIWQEFAARGVDPWPRVSYRLASESVEDDAEATAPAHA